MGPICLFLFILSVSSGTEITSPVNSSETITQIKFTKNDGLSIDFFVSMSRANPTFKAEILKRSTIEPIVIPFDWLLPYIMKLINQEKQDLCEKQKSLFFHNRNITSLKRSKEKIEKALFLLKTERAELEKRLAVVGTNQVQELGFLETKKTSLFRFFNKESCIDPIESEENKSTQKQILFLTKKIKEKNTSLKNIEESIIKTIDYVKRLNNQISLNTSVEDEYTISKIISQDEIKIPTHLSKEEIDQKIKILSTISFFVEIDFSNTKNTCSWDRQNLIPIIKKIIPEKFIKKIRISRETSIPRTKSNFS